MNKRLTRPCWVAGITWLVVSLIGALLPFNVLLILFFCAAAGLLLLLLLPSLRLFRIGQLTMLTVALTLLLLLCRLGYSYGRLQSRVGTTVELAVRIENTDTDTVRVQDGDLPVGTRLALWASSGTLDAEPYDTVSGTFLLRSFSDTGIDRLMRQADGIWLAVVPSSDIVCQTADSRPWYTCFERLREVAFSAVDTYFEGDCSAVVTGICLGVDQSLSAAAKESFRVCGVSHLFSVSGFHMVVLTGLVAWLLKKLRASRRVRILFIFLFVLLFIALVGYSPSVIRSGVVCMLPLLGDCFRRQADTRNSLGLALLILLVPDPFAAYDVGLLLSFCATFGLVILYPIFNRHVASHLDGRNDLGCFLLRRLSSAVCLTLCATVATLPVTLIFFGELSIVSILSNLLTALPSTGLMAMGCLALLFLAPGWSFLARPFLWLSGLLARYLLWICKTVAGIPFAMVTVRDPYLIAWILGGLLLLGIGWYCLRRPGMRIAAAACLLALSVGFSVRVLSSRTVTRIEPVATGGDLAVCLRQGGQVIVVTAPTNANTLYCIRAHLRCQGVCRIERLILLEGNTETLCRIPALLGTYLEHTELLCGSADVTSVLEADDLTLSPGCNDFYRMTIGDNRLLFCGGSGDVRQLAEDERCADIVFYSSRQPQNASLLNAAVGILPEGSSHPSAADCGVERLITVKEDTFCLTGKLIRKEATVAHVMD